MARYAANRVTVTRQLPYDPNSHKTLDLALFVNGIPVATAELKNPLTGQTVEHAITQYRTDRDPANVTLSRRALVHFAVDPDRVAMTTKLAGAEDTVPAVQPRARRAERQSAQPDRAPHAYLWERVWQRDTWLDILARFIHVERPAKGRQRPEGGRRRSSSPATTNGTPSWHSKLTREDTAPGSSYLVEHSAGSGKSNTIAWTAHRLSTLHDAADSKVFDKVIVITDRFVLDRQLQETIYQFEHARGVVVKIDKDSDQLAEALAGEQARIIITTLQKFPFVLDKVGELPDPPLRRHRRRGPLLPDRRGCQGAAAGARGDRRAGTDGRRGRGRRVHRRGRRPGRGSSRQGRRRPRSPDNLSFFAFTATPKARTLELFGTWNTGDRPVRAVPPVLDAPGHRRRLHPGRAGELHDLPDLLAHREGDRRRPRARRGSQGRPGHRPVRVAAPVQPRPEGRDHRRALPRPHRAEDRRAGQGDGGHVVAAPRRPLQAGDRRSTSPRRSTADLRPSSRSRARSSTNGLTYTEPQMNGFPEIRDGRAVRRDDYQVLIVAEKFQTGFDQPLLHTMYVDKVLTGLNAVQTLSRLNRIHPAKDDTFVLDFRNEAEDIVKAFEPYYGRTVAPPTDPNLLWDTRRRLDDYDVLRTEEIEAAVAVLLTIDGTPRTTGRSTPPSTRPWSGSRPWTSEDRLGSRTPSTSSCARTRSCPRWSPSATPSSSGTTSTAVRWHPGCAP